jgi:hypothetical protein
VAVAEQNDKRRSPDFAVTKVVREMNRLEATTVSEAGTV